LHEQQHFLAHHVHSFPAWPLLLTRAPQNFQPQQKRPLAEVHPMARNNVVSVWPTCRTKIATSAVAELDHKKGCQATELWPGLVQTSCRSNCVKQKGRDGGALITSVWILKANSESIPNYLFFGHGGIDFLLKWAKKINWIRSQERARIVFIKFSKVC